AAYVAAMKQMFRAQRPDQRVLHQIIRNVRIPRECSGIAAQRGYRFLNALTERGQSGPPLTASGQAICGQVARFRTPNKDPASPIARKTPPARSYSRK